MSWLTNLVMGIRALLQRSRIERELDEELQAYTEAAIEDKRQKGMSADAARRAAMAELGSSSVVKHKVWSSRWESSLDNLFQDLRIGLRSLMRQPGFTAVAILSLALGIGANSAIFTLIDQVLLRKLPVKNPQQLVAFGDSVYGGVAGGIDLGAFGGYFPWDFSRQLEMNPGPFQGIAAYGSFSNKTSVRLSSVAGSGAPAMFAQATLVSGNYFHLLGAQPLLGRGILPADDAVPGRGSVVVVSHHFWQSALSSDSAVIGKPLTINGIPFEIVGVMPEAFHGFRQEVEPTDLWTPISMQVAVLQHPSMLVPQSGQYFLHLFGRLSEQASAGKAGVLESQNWLNQQIRLGILAREGGAITPERRKEIEQANVPLVPAATGVSLVRSQYGDSLKILMAVVVVVLLIACANLANFLLARGAARQREIATRLALGSSRVRLVRQSLMEAMLLSLFGGALGLGLAFAATRALIAFVSQGSEETTMSATPNMAVLGFTFGVSMATALLFGLAPSMVAARLGERGSLNTTVRTVQGNGGRASRFWPKMLITAQVMLSLLLLVGAGLLVRTLRNLQHQNFGFERTHLLLATIDEKLAGYQPHQTPVLHQLLLDRLSAIPGVRSAALSGTPPISEGVWSSNISPAGYTPGPKENMVSVLNRVSGRYFETAGITLVAGRSITPEDTAGSLKVAVISESIAKRYFPRGEAVGRMLTLGIDSVRGPWRIVGIVRNTKSGNPRETEPVRMTYIPLAQIDPYTPVSSGREITQREENQDRYAYAILLRTTADPAKMVGDLRAAVASIDPNLPLLRVTTIEEQVSNLIANDQLISTLTSVFSILALLLAAIGLYGVMSYHVVQRTTEIGVRIALGAQLETVLWMILKESLSLLAVGVSLGLPLTLLATRSIRSQLFGLSAVDPLTFAIAIAVVAGMTVFATWLPARRAAKIDPLTALRYE
ncbi:ABC transporter permease [Terriglobus albidus]|uniref:ABC transporter permease n=1 Tax=Terriglobus albidus TaxID=1592106 RepID=A0A5B9E727_9BACT|nr:ABC transporter permease [Terriglobus albidus]QEE26915.1 ABC transporter permease [Terriglobus albidus]